jgi:hypothetical protein
MEKVRMEEVETMAVELLPVREEMQTITVTNNNSNNDSAVGGAQAGAGNASGTAVNFD